MYIVIYQDFDNDNDSTEMGRELFEGDFTSGLVATCGPVMGEAPGSEQTDYIVTLFDLDGTTDRVVNMSTTTQNQTASVILQNMISTRRTYLLKIIMDVGEPDGAVQQILNQHYSWGKIFSEIEILHFRDFVEGANGNVPQTCRSSGVGWDLK
ncbi:hypothetical protein [Carp edema virus]|nr:hypothetical protein [Carp edema virus]